MSEHVAFGPDCPRLKDDPPSYCVPCYEDLVRRAARAWAVIEWGRKILREERERTSSN